MSVRVSVMKQGKAGSSAVSRSLAASRKARGMKKSLARAASLVAPSLLRTGGYSFRAQGGKELNFVETAIATSANSTGTVTLLNGIAGGTSASQRVGRRVQMKSLEFKGRVEADSTTTVNLTRYAVVLDKQSNGAAPSVTDIYDAVAPQSLRNISNKARFWVLWDSGLIPVVGNNTTAGQQTDKSQHGIEFYKRINIPVQYNSGVGGTVTDIQTNGLFFVAVGQQAAGTADSTISGQFRIRYDDS